MSPKTKRQRVYQSLSSTFSRKSSTRADSPEPIPPSAAALSNPGPNQEEEIVVPDIVEQFCRPMEDDGGQSPRQEPTMSDSVDEAIPALPQQSKLDGSLRAVESHLVPPQGTFAHPPTIDEVTLALEDLKKILHPPQHTGRGYKDPELDDLVRNRLEGMRQFMWTYINPN